MDQQVILPFPGSERAIHGELAHKGLLWVTPRCDGDDAQRKFDCEIAGVGACLAA